MADARLILGDTTISRRGVLCGIAALSVGLTTAAMSESADAAMKGVTQSAAGKIQVNLKLNPALAKVGGVLQIPLSDGSSLAVVRTKAGVKGLSAISLSCTHQGVTVAQQGNEWVCPAHGSQFGIDGHLIAGPARSALMKYPVTATATTATIG
jgi:Rieske Fe-S protein